jgi:hypothetical protein
MNPKTRLIVVLFSIGLVVTAVNPVRAANSSFMPQQTTAAQSNNPLNFLAQFLNLPELSAIFNQASNFFAALTGNSAALTSADKGAAGVAETKSVQTNIDKSIIADYKDSIGTQNSGSRTARVLADESEAMGRFSTSADGQQLDVDTSNNISGLNSLSDKANAASESAQSTFDRVGEQIKVNGALVKQQAISNALSMTSNRIQSAQAASQAAYQKRTIAKETAAEQAAQAERENSAVRNQTNVWGGPAFYQGK